VIDHPVHPGAQLLGVVNIPGPAATKGSTKSFVSFATGRVVTKTDSSTLASWTAKVGWALKQHGVRLVPKPGAVAVRVILRRRRPAKAKSTHPTTRPDCDKILRATLDALTGIAYDDDSQVVEAVVTKQYFAHDETLIYLWEWP
jgi:crossover junction endodeoxyribonuclease RusA